MKVARTLKTLTILGLTTLTLGAASSQADSGYYPYQGANPYANPWLNAPAYQYARHQVNLRERQAQLDQRLDNQLQRILKGMEAGKVSMREATALLREHLEINALERRYVADGRLGPNELAELDRRLDAANRHIVFEAHDRDQRGPVGGPDEPGRRGEMGRR